MSTRISIVLLAGSFAGAVVACGSVVPSDGRPTVAVAFFPIEEIVRKVGGDSIHVVPLGPRGQEAHEFDPTPQQLTALERADIVVYLGEGFQPNLQKAIDSLPGSVVKVDLLKGLTLLPVSETSGGETLGNGSDPHVWLDPRNMIAMAGAVTAALTRSAPTLSATFATNATAFDDGLTALDAAFGRGLESCASRILVTSHRAFGYLANAYRLTQISIAGVSPTDEPSAKTIKAVADYALAHGATTIFYQNTLSADLATTVADEIGVPTAVLDSIESPSKHQLETDQTYESIMRQNLSALRSGLRCT